MPRQLRIQYAGAVYYVMARGDRREDIVHDDEDRAMFVAALAEACKKTGSRASHDVAEAERLLRDGMDRLGMERATVSELPGSDPRKVAMAHAVHALTAVPHTWTEEKLGMRSAANVSQHLCRLARGEVKLTKEAKAWLSQTMRQC